MEITTTNKIVCFGELLLHFAPDTDGNWLDNQSLKLYVGGAEYNVASALAQWGNPLKMLSALPQNYLANQLENRLNKEGIDVVADRNNGRMGTFYLPSDGDMQNAGVIYDRFPSAFTDSDFFKSKNKRNSRKYKLATYYHDYASFKQKCLSKMFRIDESCIKKGN